MIEIIPAIDLIEGQCVRLRQGDYSSKKVYDADPVSAARRFAEAGIRRLHLVDLDGARAGMPCNLGVLGSICSATDLIVDYSGGLRTLDDVSAALDAGAGLIGLGSLAVRDPREADRWITKYGAERFLLGADVLEQRLAVNGWEERSDVELFPFLESMSGMGIRQVFCTDISKDGMLGGPAHELYRAIRSRFPELRLIASGGVRDLQDIDALESIGCSGVIIGKAIYEGRISLEALTRKIISCESC